MRKIGHLGTARSTSTSFALGAALSAAVVGSVSCTKSETQPAAQYAAPAAVAPTPAFPDVSATLTPTLAGAPAAASAPGPRLSQPNALAFPCATDAQCLTHRCNVAAGKCAWPCQSDNDCVPGNTCIAPTCLPKLQ